MSYSSVSANTRTGTSPNRSPRCGASGRSRSPRGHVRRFVPAVAADSGADGGVRFDCPPPLLSVEANLQRRLRATPIHRAPMARPARPPPPPRDPNAPPAPPGSSSGGGGGPPRHNQPMSDSKPPPLGYICYRCGQKGECCSSFLRSEVVDDAIDVEQDTGSKNVPPTPIEPTTTDLVSSAPREFPKVSSPPSRDLGLEHRMPRPEARG